MARTKQKAAKARGVPGTEVTFNTLPPDVIAHISGHLDTQGVGRFGRTSKANQIDSREARRERLMGETDRINLDVQATKQKFNLLKNSGAVAIRNLNERLDKLSTKKTMVATAKLNYVD